MQTYMINLALEQTHKSLARDHKHGAICVIGGKIVSTGFNRPSDPYQIKVREKGSYL